MPIIPIPPLETPDDSEPQTTVATTGHTQYGFAAGPPPACVSREELCKRILNKLIDNPGFEVADDKEDMICTTIRLGDIRSKIGQGETLDPYRDGYIPLTTLMSSLMTIMEPVNKAYANCGCRMVSTLKEDDTKLVIYFPESLGDPEKILGEIEKQVPLIHEAIDQSQEYYNTVDLTISPGRGV